MRQGGVQLVVRACFAAALWMSALPMHAADNAMHDSRDALPFESEPALAAADLVIPALLNGPGYRVRPAAAVRIASQLRHRDGMGRAARGKC